MSVAPQPTRPISLRSHCDFSQMAATTAAWPSPRRAAGRRCIIATARLRRGPGGLTVPIRRKARVQTFELPASWLAGGAAELVLRRPTEVLSSASRSGTYFLTLLSSSLNLAMLCSIVSTHFVTVHMPSLTSEMSYCMPFKPSFVASGFRVSPSSPQAATSSCSRSCSPWNGGRWC